MAKETTMATTLERRIEQLEAAANPDEGPTLILVSGVSPKHREMGSANVFGEHIARLSEESEEGFVHRVEALARSRMRSGASIVFLNELDERL